MGIDDLSYTMIRTVDDWVNANTKGDKLPERLVLNLDQYKQLKQELKAHNKVYNKRILGYCGDGYIGVWVSGIPVCYHPDAPELPLSSDDISILMDGI